MNQDDIQSPPQKPLMVVTGAAGNLGQSMVDMFANEYKIIGLDQESREGETPIVAVDLASGQSVQRAFDRMASEHGRKIAAVIHLVAYFDWSGEASPLYDEVNVEGTRRVLKALQDFDVERFIYASTMLVHQPCEPGQRIDETTPFGPRWAYPESKKRAEDAIREDCGDIPYAILRLAGVYDRQTMVPTLSHQIARIYERQIESHLYSGKLDSGQSMLHREDMLDAFRRTVERRSSLPDHSEIIIGEPFAPGYRTLQDKIGELIHGKDDWLTIRIPKPVAAAGAVTQARLEPVIPDAIDQGEKPFIKPFMVQMADDHYALDIAKAERELGWRPKHRLEDELPDMIADLKKDPKSWYERNGVTPPHWINESREDPQELESIRVRAEQEYREEHGQNRWAHFVNMALGLWLLTQP